MDHTNIFEQIVVKGKGLVALRGLLSVLLIIITVILLSGLFAILEATIDIQPINGMTDRPVSEYPEMIAAQRYAVDVATRGETLSEIIDPEQNFLQRLEEAKRLSIADK